MKVNTEFPQRWALWGLDTVRMPGAEYHSQKVGGLFILAYKELPTFREMVRRYSVGVWQSHSLSVGWILGFLRTVSAVNGIPEVFTHSLK